MESTETRTAISRGLRHLVAALEGRTEYGARFKRPDEASAGDFRRERLRTGAALKDFERAWKTY